MRIAGQAVPDWTSDAPCILMEVPMILGIELNREDDGRWLAEVPALPGVMCYGETREDAVARVQALALRVIADRLEHGETGPTLLALSFEAA